MTPELQRLFPRLCNPRRWHRCRLCAQPIRPGEHCCRWSGLDGAVYVTSHAHPECYQHTLDEKWDEDDWEHCMPGDVERPSS